MENGEGRRKKKEEEEGHKLKKIVDLNSARMQRE
jgi:hypothetical protein